MQIRQIICGVEVEFHQAPFHQTNTDISFKQGDVGIFISEMDTTKDYGPLFERLHARESYQHGNTTFAWVGLDLEVIQGDKKVVLKNLAEELTGFEEFKTQYDVFCFLALLRCIDPY